MQQALFDKYDKTFGTRFTSVQKKRFIQALQEDFKKEGYEMTPMKGKKMLARSNSYFFGNMKSVKTCIVVPYDTPEKRFWYKNYYYPFDGSKTLNKNVMATFGPLIILYAVIFAVLYVGKPLISTPTAASLVSSMMFLMILLLIYMMMHGIRNKHNTVRYSSAIATALAIATRLDKDEKRKVAFLFTDSNKTSFIGAKSSMEAIRKENRNPDIICLDAFGKGDVMQVGYVAGNRKVANELVACYHAKEKPKTVKMDAQMCLQTAFAHFEKAVVIASGEQDIDDRLVVMGTQTGKDTQADMQVLQNVEDMVYTYLHKQK